MRQFTFRPTIFFVTGILLLSCLSQVTASDDGLLPEPRRIITVNDVSGAAMVLDDGPSVNSISLNGSTITRIWETGTLPVSLEVRTDVGASAGNAYREGFVGSSLYVADIPPGSDLEDVPLHAQESLDYIAVMEGSIVLVLPDERITMHRGDILVQAGNVHSWVNETDAPVRLLVVVLTGETPN